MSASVPNLGFGEFFGKVTREADAHGVSVRELHARTPPGEIPRHTHEDPHVCFVLSGRYEAAAGGLAGSCPPATLLFHPAGTTHQDQLVSEHGCLVVASIGRGLLGRLGEPRLRDRPAVMPDAELALLGRRLRLELRDGDGLSGAAMESLALEIVAGLLHRPGPSDRSRPGWLARATEFIRARAAEGVRAGEVAEAVGVHPAHLARTFRLHLGLSPVEYLRRTRVEAAAERIERSREPLAWVAAGAGFCDQSEMTKAFRRELGTTPGAYRRAVRA